MQTSDPSEIAETALSPFKTYCALLVSILAMVLAVCNLGGSNTGKDAMMNNILASNMYSFYQAKNVRQTQYKLAVDDLEIQLTAGKLTLASKQLLQDKVAAYKKTIERYESEAENGEGKKELMAKAKAYELDRDIALKKDPWFDYAEGLLQLAIVLTSVGIITERHSMAYVSFLLGTIGCVSTLNGFFLFF